MEEFVKNYTNNKNPFNIKKEWCNIKYCTENLVEYLCDRHKSQQTTNLTESQLKEVKEPGYVSFTKEELDDIFKNC